MVSDCVLGIDVRIGRRNLRIIAVYVPHAGYSWDEFEICMSGISCLTMEVIDKGMFQGYIMVPEVC